MMMSIKGGMVQNIMVIRMEGDDFVDSFNCVFSVLASDSLPMSLSFSKDPIFISARADSSRSAGVLVQNSGNWVRSKTVFLY